MLHEGADVARDGHLVVVQDDDHGKLGLPDVVQRLEGHASAKRRVADERDNLVRAARKRPRLGKPHGNRKRVGRVAGSVHVVFALGRLREAGDTVERAQRAEAIAPPRHELVCIRLVPHVEDELVFGAVKEAMNCEDDLDRTKGRRHMTTCFRSGGDDLLPDLASENRELIIGEKFQVGR